MPLESNSIPSEAAKAISAADATAKVAAEAALRQSADNNLGMTIGSTAATTLESARKSGMTGGLLNLFLLSSGAVEASYGDITTSQRANDINLTHVEFGQKCTAIGSSAFVNCPALVGPIVVPKACTSIADNAFESCTSIPTLVFEEDSSMFSIGNSAFNGCTALSGSFDGPDLNLSALSSLSIIGAAAFFNTGFVGSLTLPESLTTIGDDAFNAVPFTGTLNTPDSVTSIGSNAFNQCGFDSIYLGASLATIGDYAFYQNANLTYLYLGSAPLTSIGSYAFYYCSAMSGDLPLPNSLLTIGDGAFRGTTSLTGSLTLGNSLTTISQRAFSYTGLTGNVTIPASVTFIGSYAFYYANGFSDLTFLGNPTLDTDAFRASNSGGAYGFYGTLDLGSSITAIPQTGFYGQSFSGTLSIPASVASIGNNAFGGCANFTRIEIHRTTAPTFGTNVFDAMVGVSPAEIHVPVGATGYAASYDGLTVVYDL